MSEDYIRGRALAVYGEAREIVSESVDEQTDEPIGKRSDFTSDPESESVDGVGDLDITLDNLFGMDGDSRGQSSEEESAQSYARKRGFERDSTPAGMNARLHVESTQKAAKRLSEIARLNERLAKNGSTRRYVATAADAPESAHLHRSDDEIAAYYHDVGDANVRPSDVAKHNGDESWWLYDEDERILKTIITLADEYGEAVRDVDSTDAAYSLTDRTLVTEDERPGDEDTFGLREQDAIVAVCNRLSE